MFRKITASLFIGLILTTLFATYRSALAADSLSDGVLRLHILAASDSPEDQARKEKVRDAVLAYGKDLFGAPSDKEAATETVARHLDELEQLAEETLRREGDDSPVHAEITRCYFPTKEYDNGLRLPAGYYDALRLTIGEGKGRNWWCILYPPLCFGGSVEESEDALRGAVGSDSELATGESEQIRVGFKLAEWWGEFLRWLRG